MFRAVTRLDDAIAELAKYNDDPAAGGMTREVYTPTYAAALDRVAGWMEEVGLAVRLDAVGNLFGRWEGAEPARPRAHRLPRRHDAQRRPLRRRARRARRDRGGPRAAREGFAPRRPVELVAWAGEEPRFGTGCVGSRAAAGTLSRADLDALRDRGGRRWRRRCATPGFDPDRLAEAELDPAAVHALLELHIEQGAVLESSGDEIGVVTAIAAPHDFTLVLRGAATHAGATPMGLRRDALTGAAEVVLVVERLARASASGTTVGTVGVVRARPGAINVVPGEVALDVDVRDSDLAARAAVVEGILAAGARGRGRARGLELEVAPDRGGCAGGLRGREVVAAVEAAAAADGARARRMISGAYHDAMILGARVPIGMIFVPSAGGISHHPDEFTAPADLDRGVQVLAGTLARLAA